MAALAMVAGAGLLLKASLSSTVVHSASAAAPPQPDRPAKSVIVVGAGAEGIMSALALARAGCQVTVLEKLDAPAAATSFANAGSISLSDTVPLASPATIKLMGAALWANAVQAPKRLWRRLGDLAGLREQRAHDDDSAAVDAAAVDAAAAAASTKVLAVAPGVFADPHFLGFSFRFLRAAIDGGFHDRHSFLTRLAAVGTDALFQIAQQEGVSDAAYNVHRGGRLIVYRHQSSFARAAADVEASGAPDSTAVVWDADAAAAHEPFLRQLPRGAVKGAVLWRRDASADCYRYLVEMERRLSALPNVEFRYGVTVRGFREEAATAANEAAAPHDRRVSAVVTEDGAELSADAVVVACGAVTPELWHKVAGPLPVYPVKGYSVTFPVSLAVGGDGAALVPNGIVVDYDRKMYSTRLGDRIRFVTGAEFSGAHHDPNWSVANATLAVARGLAPAYFAAAGGAIAESAQDLQRPVPLWMGMRPVSADGVPIISRARRHSNLFVATGHGAHGWKLSALTGLLVARLVTGDGDGLLAATGDDAALAERVRAIDMEFLDVRRFDMANWLRWMWRTTF